MSTALRAQLLSLRTLPSTVLVMVFTTVVVAGLTAVVLTELTQMTTVTSTELVEAVLGIPGTVCATIILMFAAVRTSGDYRHGTMGLRLLAEPRRRRLLGATITGHICVAVLTAAGALLATLAVAAPMLAGTGLTVDVTAPMVVAAVLGVILFGVLGSSVGIISRSQAGALSALIGWFAVEKLLGGFFGEAAAYLPFALLNSLLGAEGAPLAMTTAATALTGITLVVAVVAAVLFRRRDIS